MLSIKDLERFSDEGLDIIRELLLTENKDDLTLEIGRIIKERKERKDKSLNELFLVDRLNIDPDYIEILKNNGIFTMTQLLDADLDEISVRGSDARNQYEYARVMFDFSPEEALQKKLGRPLTQREIAESIVERVNNSNKSK